MLDEYEKRLTDEKTRLLKESTATGESDCGCTNCLKARCGKCVVCRGEASSHLSYLSGESATCLQQVKCRTDASNVASAVRMVSNWLSSLPLCRCVSIARNRRKHRDYRMVGSMASVYHQLMIARPRRSMDFGCNYRMDESSVRLRGLLHVWGNKVYDLMQKRSLLTET